MEVDLHSLIAKAEGLNLLAITLKDATVHSLFNIALISNHHSCIAMSQY